MIPESTPIGERIETLVKQADHLILAKNSFDANELYRQEIIPALNRLALIIRGHLDRLDEQHITREQPIKSLEELLKQL